MKTRNPGRSVRRWETPALDNVRGLPQMGHKITA
jgi:hypothetical protein